MTKMGSSFEYKSSHTHRGRVSIRNFCQRECSYFKGCSEDFMYLFLFSLFQIHCSCTLDLVIMLWQQILYLLLYIHLRLLLQFFRLSLHVLFLFILYTHASYILYAILYFYFILKYLYEFCLKCFKNIGCQSLLVINSLLAKFFKSLCQDRFYCIQQESMS